MPESGSAPWLGAVYLIGETRLCAPRLSYLRLTAVGIAPPADRLSVGLPSAVGLGLIGDSRQPVGLGLIGGGR